MRSAATRCWWTQDTTVASKSDAHSPQLQGRTSISEIKQFPLCLGHNPLLNFRHHPLPQCLSASPACALASNLDCNLCTHVQKICTLSSQCLGCLQLVFSSPQLLQQGVSSPQLLQQAASPLALDHLLHNVHWQQVLLVLHRHLLNACFHPAAPLKVSSQWKHVISTTL